MTFKFKRKRLWVIYVSPFASICMGLITIPYLLPEFDHWHWILPLVIAYIVFVSIHSASFEVREAIVFRRYIGLICDRRSEHAVLELSSFHDEWSGDLNAKDDHVQVGADQEDAFTCDRTNEVIAWLMKNLRVPQAGDVTTGGDRSDTST